MKISSVLCFKVYVDTHQFNAMLIQICGVVVYHFWNINLIKLTLDTALVEPHPSVDATKVYVPKSALLAGVIVSEKLLLTNSPSL